MNILFEDEGCFKAGQILADNNTSLQVELPGGKRVKVKAANVLLRFAQPGLTELMKGAEEAASAMDTDFLWEACPDHEFGFEEFAADYYGQAASPVEAAALLLRLHAAPMYFHRKGKGRFRKAPPEILQAALAGQEKKRQQALTVERMVADLKAGKLPDEFRLLVPQLLYKPDRNRLETKALETACAETGLSTAAILQKCGAIRDTHEYHLGRFLFEYFPNGTEFQAFDLPANIADLPMANVEAFSIDDAHTTEIDDAFSIEVLPDGSLRVGIHIAAPGLGMAPDSALGEIARSRLSTVYMPGRKITMLPEAVVEHFTLAAGQTVPALSLYLDVASDLKLRGHETRIERVPVVANLRHHDIEPLFNAETLATGLAEFPFSDKLRRLWELATVLEAGRGKAGGGTQRKDYNFHVDWNVDTSLGKGHIDIDERPRGSPLDMLVAELMIVANSTWGALLRDASVVGLYRAQSAGKVRMTTVAAAHEGLGVDCYAWSSSPLRRYVDLVNQWQLIALLTGSTPPFGARSETLLSALRDFELTYAAYAEFQRGMEHYWCLRALMQDARDTATARVVRESLVVLEDMPLFVRIPSLPAALASDRGARVSIEIEKIDLLDAGIRARYVELLPADAVDTALDTDEEAVSGE
ncbi:MAG: RNB domain-containing ribonuclease [Georgfuchsia sp.]